MKVGLLGAGFMGRTHAAAYARLPGRPLAAVADARWPLAEALAGQHGAVVRPLEDILADPDIGVVDICLPTHLHADVAIAAARRGKHVLCEKPLALDVASARRVVDACRESGVKLGVAHVLRFSPDCLRARELVTRGEIGPVRFVKTFRGGPFPGHGWDGWYADPEKSGGCLLDLAIHDFDFVDWLAGPVRRIHCRALDGDGTDARGGPRRLTRWIHATLVTDTGAIASVEASWAEPPGTPFDARTEIHGESGSLEFSERGGISLVARRGSTGLRGEPASRGGSDGHPDAATFPPQEEVPLDADGYAAEIEAFLNWVEGGAPFAATGEDGLAALAICEAAAESLRTGAPVEVRR